MDRQFLAKELGFTGGVCPNSMDAVSDRDYAIEAVFWCALTLTHLSRWAEDLIIYSSGPFGMVQCSDAYATGSSLMPQKKNPDALELVRGKAGRLQGNLAGIMATIKNTPTTYNKDFQECWDLMFDSIDTAFDVIRICTGALPAAPGPPAPLSAPSSVSSVVFCPASCLCLPCVPSMNVLHALGTLRIVCLCLLRILCVTCPPYAWKGECSMCRCQGNMCRRVVCVP